MPVLASSNSAANKIWCKKYWLMGIQFSDWVENIVGKEEIARYGEQLLLYPNMFSKTVYYWFVKMSIYGVKV